MRGEFGICINHSTIGTHLIRFHVNSGVKMLLAEYILRTKAFLIKYLCATCFVEASGKKSKWPLFSNNYL